MSLMCILWHKSARQPPRSRLESDVNTVSGLEMQKGQLAETQVF